MFSQKDLKQQSTLKTESLNVLFPPKSRIRIVQSPQLKKINNDCKQQEPQKLRGSRSEAIGEFDKTRILIQEKQMEIQVSKELTSFQDQRDKMQNKNCNLARQRQFLKKLLASQQFYKDQEQCQEITQKLINHDVNNLSDYFSAQELIELSKIIQESQFKHLRIKNFGLPLNPSHSDVCRLIITELNIKPTIREQCIKILIQNKMQILNNKLNQKQKLRLRGFLQEYSQFFNKDQKVVKLQLEVEKSINQQIKQKPLKERSILKQIVQDFVKNTEGQHRNVFLKLIKLLLNLFSTKIYQKQQNLKTWFSLTFECKLREFQKFINICIRNDSDEYYRILKEIKDECFLMLCFNLIFQTPKSIQSIFSDGSNSTQKMRQFSQRLKQKINQITSRQEFQIKLLKYDSSEKLANNEFSEKQDQNKLSSISQIDEVYEYIQQKTIYMYLSYLNYKQKNVKIFYNHQMSQLQINNLNIKQKIKQITKQNVNNLLFFGKNTSDQYFVACQIEDTLKYDELRMFQKQFINLHFKQMREKVQISRDLTIQQIKSLIIKNINRKWKISILHDTFRLLARFQSKMLKQLKGSDYLYSIEKQFGKLESLQIQLLTKVTLYYNGDEYKFHLWQKQPILELKTKIKQMLLIPVQSQIIQYQKNNIIEEVYDKQTLEQKRIFDQQVTMVLVLKTNLQFYGFHQNRPLKYQRFKQFFIQKQETRNDYLKNCNLRQNQEEVFFNKIIPYFFSALKKRMDLTSIIKFFRFEVSDYQKQDIWTSKQKNTFNSTFILYYLLYNSEPKLRVEIMNLVKHEMPLPLYFREFHSITSIENIWSVNEQLIWILQQQFNIVSIGIHTENLQGKQKKEKGKSELLNKIFYTNFSKRQNKHGITLNCPEICIRIYGNYYPANLIDIGSETPSSITDDIIKKADFIIVQSWVSEEETKLEIDRIQKVLSRKNVYVFTIFRDVQMDKKNNWITESKKIVDNKIEIFNLLEISDPTSIQIVIQEIKNHIHKKIQEKILENNCKLPLVKTQNWSFLELQQILIRVKQVITKFRTVTQKYKQYQQKFQKSNRLEIEINNNLQDFKLHPIIQELLKFVSKNMSKSDLLMDRIRERFKCYKNWLQQQYKILVYAKNEIDSLYDQNSNQYKQKVKYYTQRIFALPGIKSFGTKSRTSVINGLSRSINHYENNIKTEILSVQLFWRQIYLLIQINPKYSLGQVLLIDFVIDVQRSQIFSNQPFQLLDGDTLRMPKTIIKKIFDSIKGTAATIIILGPQSSGKSTLLNYLFGCDFKTSQGRCTRGVYGTYFNISGNSMFNCSSIFLIDTQGLLSITSQKDQKIRKNFDSNLILFCLAVSDFVIINTKSDLDSETINKLQACKKRLPTLSQNSNPQFWLIMNQSQTSDLTNKASDVNRLQNLFDLGNSRCLSQAFETEVLSKQQICILDKDILLKKKSKIDFQKLTVKLQNDIMQKVSKKTYKCVPQIIDKMEVIWETIRKFPDLVTDCSDQVKLIDNKINKWKEINGEKLNSKKNLLLQSFKNDLKKCQEVMSQFDISRRQFQKTFQDVFSTSDKSQQIIDRINLKRKVITQQFDYILKNLQFGIQDYQMKKKIELQEKEGSAQIKAEIKRIKIHNAKSNKKISEQQKIKRFQIVFSKTVMNLQKSINSQQQIKDMFQRVKKYYELHMKQKSSPNSQTLDRIVLPTFTRELKNGISYDQTKRQILKQFYKQKYMMVIQYSSRPHTNVLAGGKTDASLKYFNMQNYFLKVKTTFYLTITANIIFDTIKIQQLKRQVQNCFFRQKQKHEKAPIRKIANQINSCLSCYGIKFKYIQELEIFLQKTMKVISKKSLLCRVKNYFYSLFGAESSLQNTPQLVKTDFNIQNRKQSQYLDSNELQKLRERNNFKMLQKTALKNISQAIIKHVIKFEEIQKQLASIQKNVEQKEDVIIKFTIILQQQFSSIGISFNAKSLIQKMINNEEIDGRQYDKQCFKSIANSIKNTEQFCKSLKKLVWIKGVQIQKKFQEKQSEEGYYIVMATLQKQVIKPKQEKQKYQIQKYLGQQSRQVIKYLQSEHIKQFLCQQLRNGKVFDRLFDEFDKIIKIACQKHFSLAKTVKEIFSEVIKQIRMFDDDIGQLSHKLSLKFKGFCHRYVVQMTSKKLQKEQQQRILKPIEDWKQQKQKQFAYFMNMTSDKVQEVSNGQVELFIKKLLQLFRSKTDKLRQNVIKKEIQRFQQKNTRSHIQKLIDQQTFNINSDPKMMIEYIQSPKLKIEQKYRKAIQQSIVKINHNLLKQSLHQQLLEQLRNVIQEVLKKLKITYQVISSEGAFQNFFTADSLKGEQISLIDGSLSQQSSIIFMQYFIDFLLNRIKKQYTCQKIKVTVKKQKQKYIFSDPISQQLTKYFINIQKQKISMTNIIIFLQKLSSKMEEIKQKFDKQINIIKLQMNTLFTKEVAISVCSQKCPCCGRLCGLEGSHSQNHQCLFGHQIRAFGGVKFENGDASVQRCEDMTDTSKLKYNGRVMVWRQFKQQQQKRKWNFQDLSNADLNRKNLFTHAWKTVGQHFCQKLQMKFVEYNSAVANVQGNIHFIFALDQSGSMNSPGKWPQLIATLNRILPDLKSLPDSQNSVKISVLKFSNTCDLVQQYVSPNNTNFNLVPNYGGTLFSPAFEVAYKLMQKYHKSCNTMFILLTDGEAEFPSDPIKKIKKLKYQTTNKIMYSNIQFQCRGNILRDISKQLQGRNFSAYTPQDLYSAFHSSIELIKDKI